ncbi:MAG: beta-galactosidase, partial [Victivallaceae bacterium]|nr:beta-galactosidase [Victivallaceae bacterium]
MKGFHLKNGVLYWDGKAVLAIGQSYYPSFHPKKMPVPPDQDQYGQMQKDLQAIRGAGFNILRTAAIGDISFEQEKIRVATPLIDRMIEDANALGIAMMVRLQGYSVNLHGWKDTRMIRQDGTVFAPGDWANFIQDSLYHEGILADNRQFTLAAAGHFARQPGVSAFVTYNEPHYPADGIYDYHPAAVRAYRKWLVETGRCDAESAKSAEPPRRRPNPGESPIPWIDWRMFSLHSLTDFLTGSSAITKAASPAIEQLTCLTPNMLEFDNSIKGVDYFRVAEKMDLLGLTLYKNAGGADYDTTAMILACAESAAALCHKHFWMVEIDAATDILLRRFFQQSLLAVGMGAKGLMFYQWRGDYPFPGDDTPEPNGFGFVNYDGSPTEHYAEKVKLIEFLNRLSPRLVNAERMHSPCGILFSHYAAFHCDALENAREQKEPRFRLGRIRDCNILHNSCMASLRRIYSELRREFVQPVFVEARHLKDNAFAIQSLYVPAWDFLSAEEQSQVLEFQKSGGSVWLPAEDIWQPGLNRCGYELLHRNKTKFDAALTMPETLETNDIRPCGKVSSGGLAIEWLQGEQEMLAVVTNISSLHETISGATLQMAHTCSDAIWYPV